MNLLQGGSNQTHFDSYTIEKDFEENEKSTFISKSLIMKRVYEQIEVLANQQSSVLVLGERGTGRERTAREIFYSGRNEVQKKFLSFVCYNLDESYIEQKLFGSEGLLYKDSNLTLFIKGLETFSFSLQNSLLSFLKNSKNKKKGPRLIFATTSEIVSQVNKGEFSEDLFKLLSQRVLKLPLLCERPEDIPCFIFYFNNENHFLSKFSDKALELIQSHSWKGNIKELQDFCFQISVSYLNQQMITEVDVATKLKRNELGLLKDIYYEPKLNLESIVNHYIQLSLNHFQSKKESAEALGISVKTIYNKIKKGVISFPD